MLIDASESVILSNLGWVDHGAVWVCQTATSEIQRVELGQAKYLSLHEGRKGLCAVAHHFDADLLELTAHEIARPARILSRISIKGHRTTFEGDTTTWDSLPRAYVAYHVAPSASDFFLFLVDARARSVELHRFDWYDNSYDHGYQGIVGVVEIPDSPFLIVSVQRDSRPVMYDPANRKVVRKLALAGRHGNPTLRFRRTEQELWADDYDTLARLSLDEWVVKDRVLLQDAQEGAARFIGAFCFNPGESLCAVARPFSGDVVALDTSTFRITHRAIVGRQPHEVALLADGRVFARDWKTGDLLSSQLERDRNG